MTDFAVENVKGKSAELSKLFTGRSQTICVKPRSWTYIEAFKSYFKDFQELEFCESDTSVLTFPKSGTTWMQEVVWTMRNNPNLDNPMGAMPLNIRSPVMEVDALIEHLGQRNHSFAQMFSERFPDFDQSHGMVLHVARISPQPRVVKTHLPFELLSPTILDKGKVVYVIRDPRDVCLSYYHHCRIFPYENFSGTLDEFVDAFINDAVLFGPYWEHVKQAWEKRHHPNMHIAFYEKLKVDPIGEIRRLDKFLGTKLTDEQIAKIAKHSTFDEMQKRNDHVVAAVDAPSFMNVELVKKDGGFFRKGAAGGWRKVLTDDQKNKFELWNLKKCPDPEILDNIYNP